MRFATVRTSPVVILTLGLFLLVSNGLMLWLTSALSDKLARRSHVRGFRPAFWGALVMSIVSGLLSLMMTADRMSYRTER